MKRKAARELGQSTYVGRGCPQGHRDRYVSTGKCVQCSRERSSRNAVRFRDKIRARRIEADGEWRRRNKDRLNARRRELYREKHPPLVREALSPEERRRRNVEAQKRWREAHREKRREHKRARKKAKRADFRACLVNAQRGRCVYCRTKLGAGFHVDHIEPLARGGADRRSNMQALCPPCNLAKNAKDPIAFAQERGMLV